MGQTQTPLSPSSRQLRQVANATANNKGVINFTFNAPPTGFTWTGTLSCTNAPASASFTASIGGINWAQWNGESVGGPIQLFRGDVLTVAATGLSPNTEYLLWLIGTEDESGLPGPVWPDPTASLASFVPATATQLFLGTTIPFTATVPPATRTLIVQVFVPVGNTMTLLTVTGGETGFPYYNQAAYLSAGIGSGTQYLVIVPIVAALDTTVIVTPFLTGGTCTTTLFGDSTEYDESIFYNGVPVATSTTATSVSLFVGPGRLLSADLNANGAGSASMSIGGVIVANVSPPAGVYATTQHDFPQPFIIPFGVQVGATITAPGRVSISTAFP